MSSTSHPRWLPVTSKGCSGSPFRRTERGCTSTTRTLKARHTSSNTRLETAIRMRPHAREVLTLEQPRIFHNGGGLSFTHDGLLWISTGDGGLGTQANTPDNLYGSILRIDPTPSNRLAYSIPPDNPYPDGQGGRPEVWLHGARNPWRFTVDEISSDLWVADVGQDCWEEINFLGTSDGGGAGRDLGWNRLEGDYEYRDSGTDGSGVTFAAFIGAQDDGYCSIAGGVVYRGTVLPELQGWYLFADWCIGEVTAIRPTTDGGYQVRRLGLRMPGIVSLA